MKKSPKKAHDKDDTNPLNKTNNRELSIDKMDSNESAVIRNSDKGPWDIFRGQQDELEKSKIVEVLDIGLQEENTMQPMVSEKVFLKLAIHVVNRYQKLKSTFL